MKSTSKSTMKHALFVIALSFAQISWAGNVVMTAKVYEPESQKQKVLFNYVQISEQRGDERRVAINTFTDAGESARVAVIETTEYVKMPGETLENVKSYRVEQKQLNAEGDVEIRDGKAHFRYKRDGKEKVAVEAVGENFVVGPSIPAHLRKHWATVTAGQTVKVRLAVLDRQETVGFDLFKDREEVLNGKQVIVLKMKPSSFLIAALVKPLYFFMSSDGQTLFEVHGRSQAKRQVDGAWKDLDAVTVYEKVALSGSTVAPATPDQKGGKKK